ALAMTIAEGQGDLVRLIWPVKRNTCIRRIRQHRESFVFSCIPTLSPLLIERLVLDRFDSLHVIFLRPPRCPHRPIGETKNRGEFWKLMLFPLAEQAFHHCKFVLAGLFVLYSPRRRLLRSRFPAHGHQCSMLGPSPF